MATQTANGNGTTESVRERVTEVLGDMAPTPRAPWFPGLAGAKLAAKLAARPGVVAKRGASFGAELAKVVAGRSEVAPQKGDRRFKDEGWQQNPFLRRLLQAHLATEQTVSGLVEDAGLDWRSRERASLAAENLLGALSPSNLPWVNPTVLKAVVDTGGLNFVQGARNLAGDLRNRPLLPASVDDTKFEVGKDLAATPGQVVLRTDVFELIQYAPTTDTVRATPLLLCPQMINKYYVTDLAPGKSMMEHAVAQGLMTFAMSWRNPGSEQADWDWDTYAQAVLEALDAIEEITGSGQAHVMGLCAGGTILASVVGHLAATDRQDRIATLTLGVNAIDMAGAGAGAAFLDDISGTTAMAESRRRGYLRGESLAEVFAWMRPNDMIWGYWVNNYLLGQKPPPFDILFWNGDQTNMPAALHRDFVEQGLENSLVKPEGMTVLGTPVDLGKITVPVYLVAGIADHLVPWQSAYKTTQLMASKDVRFVLSTSGHIAAMVNPPGNPKANFRANAEHPKRPKAWLEQSETVEGSWWPDWTAWLTERSGEERDAPAAFGSERHAPLEDAPGSSVRVGTGADVTSTVP